MQNIPAPESYSYTGKKAIMLGTDVSKLFTFPYSLTGSTFNCDILDRDDKSIKFSLTCTINVSDDTQLLVTGDKGSISSSISAGDYIIRLKQTDASNTTFLIFQGTINFYD